jgi:hypothetical protein
MYDAEVIRHPRVKVGRVDNSHDAEVFAVLLGFGLLSDSQRAVFTKYFNDFLYGSNQEQDKSMDQWIEKCRNSTYPGIQRVAESAADYRVKPKKKRR